MGCDIHVHTEIKVEGVWRHWGAPNGVRLYTLFEKMAGVRGSVEKAVSPPKGLPSDMTFETAFEYSDGEGTHSASWLSREEIAKVCAWWERYAQGNNDFIENHFGYLMGNSWMSTSDDRIEDVRWVFWFDN